MWLWGWLAETFNVTCVIADTCVKSPHVASRLSFFIHIL